MGAERSSLLTSPLSMADFAARLVFFSVAPSAIVLVAELFPVRGALIDVGLALLVFATGEAVQRWTARLRILRPLLGQAFEFEAYYRARPPRPFLYYLAYPLLFPYWLVNRDARREFLMFRGYTVGGLIVLLVSLGLQYVLSWRPELGLRAFLPTVALSLVVETLLVLALLMPIATTVVWYHSSFRRGRLRVLLFIGLFATGVALARVARHRDPLVSYATRERVVLRTAAAPARAHAILLAAARAAWHKSVGRSEVEGDGKVEGAPAEAAHQVLEGFYKHDEAYAFDLWASPRSTPRVLVVYFEARRHKRPIWLAIRAGGSEVTDHKELPRAAFGAMRKAADGSDPTNWVWPEEVRPHRPARVGR